MSSHRADVLRVHTFAVPSTARYALPKRRHRGGPPVTERSAVELYRCLRGATIAAGLASDSGHQEDVLIALCKTQALAAELTRRLIGPVTIEVDRATTLIEMVDEALRPDPSERQPAPGGRRGRGCPLGTSGSAAQ